MEVPGGWEVAAAKNTPGLFKDIPSEMEPSPPRPSSAVLLLAGAAVGSPGGSRLLQGKQGLALLLAGDQTGCACGRFTCKRRLALT